LPHAAHRLAHRQLGKVLLRVGRQRLRELLDGHLAARLPHVDALLQQRLRDRRLNRREHEFDEPTRDPALEFQRWMGNARAVERIPPQHFFAKV
jgi:hypothetical protein